MRKTALIIGITGQDGAYLSERLLSKGMRVIGSSRDCQTADLSRLERIGIANEVEFCSMSPTDFRSVLKVFSQYQPDYVYNLAGLTSVGLSFELPVECIESIATATVNLLEVIKFLGGDIRFFNAGSSETFGNTGVVHANEHSMLKPLSPYAVAKASAFWQVSTYREAYGLYCCTGILSNHESPLRPDGFVTQKLVKAAKQIKSGKANQVVMGNIDISRDWGWAAEYVEAMEMMLEAQSPEDFIIATGTSNTLGDLARIIFRAHDLEFDSYYVKNDALVRPSDIQDSRVSAKKIHRKLGWKSKRSINEIGTMLAHGEYW